ncbi:hypothetical protein WMY93_007606 [Mugilogobius chulae]|uniref:Uncharacterized protein n=1 Tax=Mugilogobius chulae TaxID=88201 RepID=A0AAW0PEX3_9GOBI
MRAEKTLKRTTVQGFVQKGLFHTAQGPPDIIRADFGDPGVKGQGAAPQKRKPKLAVLKQPTFTTGHKGCFTQPVRFFTSPAIARTARARVASFEAVAQTICTRERKRHSNCAFKPGLCENSRW